MTACTIGQAVIKEELDQIGDLLTNPNDHVETFLDYLPIPRWMKPFAKRLPGMAQPKYAKCKLAIVVDDLDRCPPDKAVEVLQSLVLLTENTPFIIFLAIDPRIVVTAIETTNAKFFGECGVNGYEYLDKIVNIPFAIPQLADNEKRDLCNGYLAGPTQLPNSITTNLPDIDDRRSAAGDPIYSWMRVQLCNKAKAKAHISKDSDISFKWKDQGFGNRKGHVFVRCFLPGDDELPPPWIRVTEDVAQHTETTVDAMPLPEELTMSALRPQSVLELGYRVGGGGHALYISKAIINISFANS